MKTIHLKKALLMVLTIALFGTGNAVGHNLSDDAIRESIISKVSYPVFARESLLQGEVNVCFGFKEDGSIIIYSALSEQKELADYVKKAIADFRITNTDIDSKKQYSIVIKFKLL